MISGFNFSCQGESHKRTNKPCQDYSYCGVADDGVAIAIVCDGHGGDRYFRSGEGAKIAAEITNDAVNTFVKEKGLSLLEGKPFTAFGPVVANQADSTQTKNFSREVVSAFRQLFSSIIYRWGERIRENARNVPLNEWEKNNVPSQYINDFLAHKNIEKAYGCTLMTYVRTPKYWFAFHLGDGKLIAFDDMGKYSEPVPWDDKCFLNTTTSLCDSAPLNEFRYCYQGDGKFPVAVFLGSDGMDDSYPDIPTLAEFYIRVMQLLATDGIDVTRKELEETLPVLSRNRSRDDMSVASVFDLDILCHNLSSLFDRRIEFVDNQCEQIQHQIQEKASKLSLATSTEKMNVHTSIDINYIAKDISDLVAELQKLMKKKADILSDRNKTLSSDKQSLSENSSTTRPNIDSDHQGSTNISADSDEPTSPITSKEKNIPITSAVEAKEEIIDKNEEKAPNEDFPNKIETKEDLATEEPTQSKKKEKGIVGKLIDKFFSK